LGVFIVFPITGEHRRLVVERSSFFVWEKLALLDLLGMSKLFLKVGIVKGYLTVGLRQKTLAAAVVRYSWIDQGFILRR
jgi:hypothetical protein